VTDIFTYVACLGVLVLIGSDCAVYKKAYAVIIGFAVFYAVSIFVQMLLPSAYQLFLQLLPDEVVAEILEYEAEGILTGFSTNRGFTAGHIAAGMLAYIGIFLSEEKSLTPKRILVMVLFALAFALTGKRGHLLFFVFAVFVVILINSRDVRWYLFLDIVLIAVMLAIPVLILLKDLFVSVPVLFRIGESLAGIMNGEDITSGRSELAAHALSLFWERPLLGVGWGVYRTTVIGVVTSRTELEVHNIYLQVLCEAGLIGFVTMVVPMAAFLRRAIKNLNLLNKCGKKLPWTKCLAVFSVAYQVFFLSYGMTGNSLYDYNYVMMYFVSCSMTAVVWRDLRKELSL